jgi:hypothetical protein
MQVPLLLSEIANATELTTEGDEKSHPCLSPNGLTFIGLITIGVVKSVFIPKITTSDAGGDTGPGSKKKAPSFIMYDEAAENEIAVMPQQEDTLNIDRIKALTANTAVMVEGRYSFYTSTGWKHDKAEERKASLKLSHLNVIPFGRLADFRTFFYYQIVRNRIGMPIPAGIVIQRFLESNHLPFQTDPATKMLSVTVTVNPPAVVVAEPAPDVPRADGMSSDEIRNWILTTTGMDDLALQDAIDAERARFSGLIDDDGALTVIRKKIQAGKFTPPALIKPISDTEPIAPPAVAETPTPAPPKASGRRKELKPVSAQPSPAATPPTPPASTMSLADAKELIVQTLQMDGGEMSREDLTTMCNLTDNKIAIKAFLELSTEKRISSERKNGSFYFRSLTA